MRKVFRFVAWLTHRHGHRRVWPPLVGGGSALWQHGARTQQLLTKTTEMKDASMKVLGKKKKKKVTE